MTKKTTKSIRLAEVNKEDFSFDIVVNMKADTPEKGYWTAQCLSCKGIARSEGKAVKFLLENLAKDLK